MRVQKVNHSARICAGIVCLFLTLDSSRATSPSMKPVSPPIPIGVTEISVQPSGPIWTGDDILIQCTVEADGPRKGPIWARLGFPQNLAIQSTIKRWIIGAEAQPSVAEYVEGYFTLDELVSGKPVSFCLNFKAHNCGYLQVDFAYGYYTDRPGEVASSREVVLSRCILKSPRQPARLLAQPPRKRPLDPDIRMWAQVLPHSPADPDSVYPDSIAVRKQVSGATGHTDWPRAAPGADSCACR